MYASCVHKQLCVCRLANMAASLSCAQADAAEQARTNRELLKELMAAKELLDQYHIPMPREPVPDAMAASGRLAYEAAAQRPVSAGKLSVHVIPSR